MSSPTMTLVRTADSAPALGPVVRPPFARLVRLELRKATDYRAGRWIVGIIAVLGVLGLGYMVIDAVRAPEQTLTFKNFSDVALLPATLLTPVLGILAMTSEWSQRTALTTFTLLPRRVPVLVAKLAAALLLTLGLFVVMAALAAVALALAGVLSGDPVSWSTTLERWVGMALSQAVFVLMGAGIGAVVPITGFALTAFFVAPTVVSVLTETVLKRVGEWFDVFAAVDKIGAMDLAGKGAQTATALVIWVVAPIVVGIWLCTRREAK